jgi:PAS domain S-box-containing protein
VNPSAAQQRTDAALLAAEVGTFQWDIPEDRLWGDANFARIFGIRVDDSGAAPLKEYMAAIHPDDWEHVNGLIRQSLETGCTYEAQYRILQDERTRWVTARGRVDRDDRGRSIRFAGIVLDITRQKQAEAALQRSEVRYQALLEAIDEGFCIIDVIFEGDRAIDYIFVDMNPAFEIHTGLRDAVGRTARELLPGLEEHWFEIYGRVARSGVPERFEQGSDAMRRWFDVFAFQVDEGGTRVGLLFKDISEQRYAREELASSRERLRAVLENSLDAAYRRDLRADSYDYLSPLVMQVLGIDADVMCRMSVAEFMDRMHPEDRDTVSAAIAKGARHGSCRVEYRFRDDEGSYRWLADHFTVQLDDDGQPRFRTGIVRDITDQKATQHALESARDAAEQANRAKSQFMAVMSHELRTPLGGVIGFADLLEAGVLGPMTDRQQEALTRIKTSSWHLVGIIDEILALARVEAGKEDINVADVDVAQIVQEVIPILEPQAAVKNLAFHAQGMNRPCTICTDPGKLRQILINLGGNAVKYTESGSISIELACNADHISIHVRDTGKGIEPGDHDRIFEPFTQVDSSYTRDSSGVGLGLAISRRFARLLGGDVTVSSQPGRGSCFTLALPR